MTADSNTAKRPQREHICPYLGLRDDPDTYMAFTSPLNYCYRGRRVAPVKLEHQGTHCLDAGFQTCPVYEAGAGKSFPRKLRGRAVRNSEYTYPVIPDRSWLLWLFVIILLGIIGGGYWYLRGDWTLILPITPTPYQLPRGTNTPTPASISTQILITEATSSISETLVPVQTSTVTPFPTLTPTLDPITLSSLIPQEDVELVSSNPTQVSSHSLEMPIGPVQKYLIHQVSAGENLTGLATRYQTSVDAILMVNITLKVPIREGSVVIMPLDLSNPDGLPALEPYQVEDDQVFVEALAAELDTDPALLKYFNLYDDGERLPKGDWILVPRVRPEAP